MARSPPPPADDFSLVLGGPLYQLYLRTRLARPPLHLLRRRMIALPAIAWLPLLVLSAIEGVAWSGTQLPFLADIAVHARYLLAIPLLVAAEVAVHDRLRPIVRQFVDEGLVADADRPRFLAVVDDAVRLRNSPWIEVLLLVVAVFAGTWLWRATNTTIGVDTWWTSGGMSNAATWWYAHVSAPLFQFLVLRWYFRIALWWRLMWKISQLPLALHAAHPDRAGGLGFLRESINGFTLVLMAQSVAVAGVIARATQVLGATPMDYAAEIFVLAVLFLLAVALPLAFFTGRMLDARRLALCEYDALAAHYVAAFERRWIERRDAADDPQLLGAADIQSLADLDGSVSIVREMRPIALDRRSTLLLAVAVLLPYAPLVFTVVSFRDLAKSALGMLL
jgi:hypothetical protein